jgi:hypothetical protein
MNPERWQRIESLFHAARALDPDARAAFLVRECATDAELRREVETLLAAAEADPDFLEAAPLARAHAAPAGDVTRAPAASPQASRAAPDPGCASTR